MLRDENTTSYHGTWPLPRPVRKKESGPSLPVLLLELLAFSLCSLFVGFVLGLLVGGLT